MAARPAWIAGWTAQHVRHAAGMFKQGGNPAARVYESIGPDFFLAVAPGWLNLGLWEGPAAFHFRSRKAFFAECYRVLRPGGVRVSPISQLSDGRSLPPSCWLA